MQEYLDDDRRAREPANAIAHRLALSPGSRSVLRYLLDRRLEELFRETKAVLQQCAITAGSARIWHIHWPPRLPRTASRSLSSACKKRPAREHALNNARNNWTPTWAPRNWS